LSFSKWIGQDLNLHGAILEGMRSPL